MAGLKQFIYIYGPPGVGKSSTGKILAESLEIPFFDLDIEIERNTKRTISDIFSKDGEQKFRKIESEELYKLLDEKSGVIALGGGTLLNSDNLRKSSAMGPIILLSADSQVIQNRLSADPTPRPLSINSDMLNTLLNDRKNHYDSFEMKLDSTNLNPIEVAWEIQKMIGRYQITGMGNHYPVYVQENCLMDIGQILDEKAIGKNIAVITDQNVADFYQNDVLASLEKWGFDTSFIVLPPGEESKNIHSITRIWRELLNNNIDRKSTIIALGGGVIGDLAGFAAATYMRGIDWIGVPTSVLAMVDSSLGGKTGIDLPEGKNLAGAFYPPKMVIVDPTVIATLPTVEIKNGLAEVIKHGIISDPDLFKYCEKGLEYIKSNWGQIIRQAMAVKVKIIIEDPFEKGIRATLNLGHTIGHAVESLSDFSIRHGEAIAIGTYQEARISENLGLADKGLSEAIKVCFSSLDLSTEIPNFINPKQLAQSMKFDKKRKDGKLFFALPKDIGEVKEGVEIDDLEECIIEIIEGK